MRFLLGSKKQTTSFYQQDIDSLLPLILAKEHCFACLKGKDGEIF